MPLYDILNEFQKGHSHIAVVYKDAKKDKRKDGQLPDFEASCKKPTWNFSSWLHDSYMFQLDIAYNVIYFNII